MATKIRILPASPRAASGLGPEPVDLWQFEFMRRALVAAVLVGLAAPAVGIFLVQRRLALIGDGLGHVAVTGVALGLVLDRRGAAGAHPRARPDER